MAIFLHKSRTMVRSLFVGMLLGACGMVSAEDWYSIGEDPRGKTMNPPAQLEDHPLGNNTEKHLSLIHI